MIGQLPMFSQSELWEQGVAVTCRFTGKECRFQPCTAAQGVACCMECEPVAGCCQLAAAKLRKKGAKK